MRFNVRTGTFVVSVFLFLVALSHAYVYWIPVWKSTSVLRYNPNNKGWYPVRTKGSTVPFWKPKKSVGFSHSHQTNFFHSRPRKNPFFLRGSRPYIHRRRRPRRQHHHENFLRNYMYKLWRPFRSKKTRQHHRPCHKCHAIPFWNSDKTKTHSREQHSHKTKPHHGEHHHFHKSKTKFGGLRPTKPFNIHHHFTKVGATFSPGNFFPKVKNHHRHYSKKIKIHFTPHNIFPVIKHNYPKIKHSHFSQIHQFQKSNHFPNVHNFPFRGPSFHVQDHQGSFGFESGVGKSGFANGKRGSGWGRWVW